MALFQTLHLPLTKTTLEVNDEKEGSESVKDSTIAPDDSALGSDTADSELSFDSTEQDTWAIDESPKMRQRFGSEKSCRPGSPKETLSAWTPSYDAAGSASADSAAGSPHRITISATGKMAWICRQAPGASLFGSMALFLIAAVFWPEAFLGLLSLLTAQVYCWIASLAIFALVGVHKMRSALATDWEARWNAFAEENPEDANACKHILILPNYKEDENMLCDTLDNLARFPLAQEQLHIVLAMECREGSAGRHKAERLIASHKHCFANIFATFHPENLPGETAGKSANCQWAFREVQREYGQKFRTCLDKVFLTVGDADSLWHPQYFLALALDGLAMTKEERSWGMWQSPVLLLRNYTSVPGPIRVSGYATFCFEMAGLAGQKYLGTHLTYSAYSLTLALANHPLVDGWDTDVIAEDHHMFCKCLFASIRSSSTTSEERLTPKVKLNPIYLPVVSYMVESSNGWLDSCRARFQQARRHSQGVAELAYTLYQYLTLINSVGIKGLSAKAHYMVLCIVLKMNTVHLTNTLHAFAVMLTSHCAGMKVMDMLYNGEFFPWLSTTLPQMLSEGPGTFEGFTYWCGTAILGSFLPLSVMMAYTSFQVVKDSIEGRTLPHLENKKDQGPSEKPEALSKLKKTALAGLILFDYAVLAETTVVIYGLIPEVLACFSLARFGNKFEYIVAAKPSDKKS
jgi:hypothetical protein